MWSYELFHKIHHSRVTIGTRGLSERRKVHPAPPPPFGKTVKKTCGVSHRQTHTRQLISKIAEAAYDVRIFPYRRTSALIHIIQRSASHWAQQVDTTVMAYRFSVSVMSVCIAPGGKSPIIMRDLLTVTRAHIRFTIRSVPYHFT